MATNILGIANNIMLQPKLTNLYTMSIISPAGTKIIPGNGTGSVEKIQIDLMNCSRPKIAYQTQTMWRLNQKYNVAGNPNIDSTIECKFRDTIQGNVSRVLWNWSQVIFNPKTGAMGYANSYKCDAEIQVMDPLGKGLEKWIIKGMYPSSMSLGQGLAYADNGSVQECDVTFTFDLFWVDNAYTETAPATRLVTGYEATTITETVVGGLSQVDLTTITQKT